MNRPLLVAIAGGSGSGKTWLTRRLQEALAPDAVTVSLDDFYKDRSHVSESRRGLINFDNPNAIDWQSLEDILKQLVLGKSAELPRYDFKTHCRERDTRLIRPAKVILIDGLWLLRRMTLRRLLDVKLFIECPAQTRLRRRIDRDVVERGRTRRSVEEQFLATVEPMHLKYVAPQRRWADVVLPHDFTEHDVRKLAARLKERLNRGNFRDDAWIEQAAVTPQP